MALWYCLRCTAGYAVGLAACPQCGATEHEEEHEHMAKITSAGVSYEPGKDPNEPPADTAPAGESTETEAPETGGAGVEASAQAPADGDGHELPPPPPHQ